jgi:flagellar biosynthesis anti-sigma factor FlgM
MLGGTIQHSRKENMELNGNNPSAVTNPDLYWMRNHPTTHCSQTADDGSSAIDPCRIDLPLGEHGLSHLIKLIQATPDIRKKKVAKIQRAIERGRYSVSVERIADKIIDDNLVDRVC